MSHTLLEATAIVTGGLVLYHHVAWPKLLGVLARRAPERPLPPPRHWQPDPGDAARPTITVLIPAYDEAALIGDKIRNLAALDYPAERLDVVIACDGCTDATAARARAVLAEPECRHLRATVLEFPVNRGKIAVLNAVLPTLAGELVLLTDVSASLSVDALLIAADRFGDPAIGVVAGTYRLAEAGSPGEAAYWVWQTRQKRGEGAIGAPIGAHGAAYFVRRRLVAPLPPDTINDDVVLPMTIVADGHRALYEPAIVALELEPTAAADDLRRRRRIGAGNLQQLVRLRSLLHPRHGGIAWAFWSGKALRTLCPLLMLICLAASLVAATWSIPFAIAAVAQLGLYGVAALRAVRPRAAVPRWVALVHYMVAGHAAAAIGAARWALARPRGPWSRQSSPRSLGEFAMSHALALSPGVARSKRAVDVIGALALIVLTLPFWPLIALAIRLDSRGPILFRQLRIGRALSDRTELFMMMKFRSMRVDAERVSGAVWASKNDPRITRVGRFLRKSRLDELPQLLNVLRGDMSLIGPRPERPGIYARLETGIPFYAERTVGVRPGITGLAQVNQGYDETLEDVRNKLRWDHAYALLVSNLRSWAATDAAIAWATLSVMVNGRGR